MPDYHVVRTQNMKAAYYATEHILDTISITMAAPDCTCLNLDSSTMGIFERNEYIPHGNELVPYENTFMRIGNEFIPTLCWNLHKPKLPKIKTFLMEKGS